MKNNCILIFGFIFITFANISIAGKLYKWVDESGNISFSDKVPPQDSRRKTEVLNKEGRVVDIKDAAKTPKQIMLLKEIKELQKVQKKLLKEQLKRDSALLKTFKRESDIDALANSKFKIIRSNISIALSQLEISKEQIALHQKSAAQFERQGKSIPKKIIKKINSSQAQLSKSQQDIVNLKQQEKRIAEQQTHDHDRLRSLQSLKSDGIEIHSDTVPNLLLGRLPCTPKNCNQLWEKANTFIATQGPTTTFSSSTLRLTKTPTFSKDIGLSLTKLKKENSNSIILDIRCANSKGGKTTCQSKKTASLIEAFNRLAH